jgi:choice-of-anchor C domain-containing protein
MSLDGAGTGRPGNDAVVRFRRRMLPNPARTELLGNGDFEPVQVRLRDKARTVLPGNKGLAPWQITAGSVDVQTYWPAVRGKHSIDLNGVAPGAIRQTFATIPRQAYQLSFCYANNPDGPTRAATATVSVTGASPRLNWKISHAGSRPLEMNYTRFLGTFIADSAMTTVQFASTTPGAYGIVLDAVSVMAVPGAADTTPG